MRGEKFFLERILRKVNYYLNFCEQFLTDIPPMLPFFSENPAGIKIII